MLTVDTEAKSSTGRLLIRPCRSAAPNSVMLVEPATDTDIALCYSRAWAERLARVTEYEAAEYAAELARVWGEVSDGA